MLILEHICVFAAFKHVEKVVMKEVEITDIDPGVRVSRLQFGRGKASSSGHPGPGRLVGVVLVAGGAGGEGLTALLHPGLVFHLFLFSEEEGWHPRPADPLWSTADH